MPPSDLDDEAADPLTQQADLLERLQEVLRQAHELSLDVREQMARHAREIAPERRRNPRPLK
jgi:hypothetical protein